MGNYRTFLSISFLIGDREGVGNWERDYPLQPIQCPKLWKSHSLQLPDKLKYTIQCLWLHPTGAGGIGEFHHWAYTLQTFFSISLPLEAEMGILAYPGRLL